MLGMQTNKLGCILADEMGLGKTLQIISYINSNIPSYKESPFLIVVPTSLMNNWMREFKKFCPEISVLKHYGKKELLTIMILENIT